jgi:hypothetical protein
LLEWHRVKRNQINNNYKKWEYLKKDIFDRKSVGSLRNNKQIQKIWTNYVERTSHQQKTANGIFLYQMSSDTNFHHEKPSPQC